MNTFQHTFERSLTPVDGKQNIPFMVQVPSGTSWLQIYFTYAPQETGGIHNLLTLTVFDPSGWRGEGHRSGAQQEVIIGRNNSSPGYLNGPVQAGTWTVVVNTHSVAAGSSCKMRLVIGGNDDPLGEMGLPQPGSHTAPWGRAWYRGDLHAHTIHSDAEWDIPDLVAFTRAQRLDFATLSDHNTTAGLAQFDAASADDLLSIGGMELTTFWGHALALGLRDWVDWRVQPGVRSMDQIEAEITARGGLFIIAHPASIGDPNCTGCDWRYFSMMPGSARVVEVWNDDWMSESNNEDGLKLVYSWLNQGCRLALTAGTDNHGHHPEQHVYGYNVVFADELTEPAILRAVRAGHAYLSAGPLLKITAAAGGQVVMMGDALHAANGIPIDLTVTWEECPVDAQLELIVDGKAIGELMSGVTADRQGSQTWELAGGQAHWGLAVLRDVQGGMLALTNPIYFDGRA